MWKYIITLLGIFKANKKNLHEFSLKSFGNLAAAISPIFSSTEVLESSRKSAHVSAATSASGWKDFSWKQTSLSDFLK